MCIFGYFSQIFFESLDMFFYISYYYVRKQTKILLLSCYFCKIFFIEIYFTSCLVEMAESGLEKRRFLWILYKFCIPIKIKSKTVDK